MMPHPAQFGSKQCTAEILMQAANRIGRSIWKGSEGGRREMNLADAIADVCTNNAEGACAAFAALHEATGAQDLVEWQKDKHNYEIANVMRETARRLAS